MENREKKNWKDTMKAIWQWIYRLRSVLLSIPVVYMALRFAKENLDRLPREVGVNLLTNGEYQFMVSREVAVVGPLAVTAFCLLLIVPALVVLKERFKEIEGGELDAAGQY